MSYDTVFCKMNLRHRVFNGVFNAIFNVVSNHELSLLLSDTSNMGL